MSEQALVELLEERMRASQQEMCTLMGQVLYQRIDRSPVEVMRVGRAWEQYMRRPSWIRAICRWLMPKDASLNLYETQFYLLTKHPLIGNLLPDKVNVPGYNPPSIDGLAALNTGGRSIRESFTYAPEPNENGKVTGWTP